QASAPRALSSRPRDLSRPGDAVGRCATRAAPSRHGRHAGGANLSLEGKRRGRGGGGRGPGGRRISRADRKLVGGGGLRSRSRRVRRGTQEAHGGQGVTEMSQKGVR